MRIDFAQKLKDIINALRRSLTMRVTGNPFENGLSYLPRKVVRCVRVRVRRRMRRGEGVRAEAARHASARVRRSTHTYIA
jgi:hypothetical protein